MKVSAARLDNNKPLIPLGFAQTLHPKELTFPQDL
jgi:hypothetical protein